LEQNPTEEALSQTNEVNALDASHAKPTVVMVHGAVDGQIELQPGDPAIAADGVAMMNVDYTSITMARGDVVALLQQALTAPSCKLVTFL
jgi:hypothetical protein